MWSKTIGRDQTVQEDVVRVRDGVWRTVYRAHDFNGAGAPSFRCHALVYMWLIPAVLCTE